MPASNELVPIQKAHADLGASTAKRWFACPGSVALIKTVPEAPPSTYAIEGTAVHTMIELCQTRGVDPITMLDETIAVEEEAGNETIMFPVKVSENMVAGAQVFLDYVRGELGPNLSKQWVEKKFSLERIGLPDAYGTADFAGYEPAIKRLHVVDYKNGSGVLVEAFENEQLMYYALGAALDLDPGEFPIDDVRITVVQPNVGHQDGLVRHFDLSYLDLLGFANELRVKAAATRDPNAPLVAGSHCRFCPASGICPAQRDAAQKVAMVEFADMPLDQPPAPSTLPDSVIFEMLPQLPLLQAWIKAMYGNVEARLLRGEEVPGYKLVARRANRSWKDEAALVAWAKADGLDDDELYTKKVRSPAQIEKVVGKKNLPADLTQKISTGYTMVAATDPRPAAEISPGAEFALLPAGESE